MPEAMPVGPAAGLILVLSMAAAAGEINPYPRELIATEKLLEWTFQAGTGGWTAAHDCKFATEGGALKITSTGDDPYLIGPAMGDKGIDGPVSVSLRMKCAAGGSGQVFWATDKSPNFDEANSSHFNLAHDGQWHEYTVSLDVAGKLARLRLDPGSAPGEIEVDRITLLRAQWHPLELVRVQQVASVVALDLVNHGTKPVEFAAGGRTFTIEAGQPLRTAIPAAGAKPFDSVNIMLEPKGLPAIRRTIFLFHPDATGDWATLKSGNLAVRLARDGSGARLELGGHVAAILAPLVHRGGVVPPMKLAEGPGGAVKFTGEGVTVVVRAGDAAAADRLPLQGGEVTVTIESDKPVEGPVVRALGTLESAIFAGLEYLGKGEKSSSMLDIETPEHVRFAPDPMKVTMPLMACVTDGGATAVTWTDMTNQPVFATPNFFDGSADHRMALRGRKIEATLLVGRTDAATPGGGIEQTVLWAVKKHGLPPLPKTPRSAEEQAKLALAALNGPIKGEGGWGHCAEPNWKRQPFADHASTLWRLTGEVPQLPKIVPGGAHVRNDAIYFVTGRAEEWLRARSGQVKGVLKEQQPDGSFRYAGKYERGHYEKTSSGHCAQRAMILLEFAWLTGDAAARDAGLKTLDCMKCFDVPRGAQTWELSLHTPDILASAYLVWACVRGYELTGKKEYLAEAQRWALSGVPFVYLWGNRPVMAYSTIAVFGATNWQAPNWMGLPVQWCGGVYAYALGLLAPHDPTLDWARLARGILLAGEQMESPDGPTVGCLPDSFALADQRRNGPFINPCGLMSLRLALDGKLDSLAVAADGKHRVVAPFPVKIEGTKAVVEAKKGLAYQVLIDGQRVVDVKSEGTDTVALE